MATITIGAHAGDYDLEVTGTDIESLMETDVRYPDITIKSIKGGHVTGSVMLEDHDGNSLKVDGVFSQNGLDDADPIKAVEKITKITVTESENVSFTISGISLTGKDLKSEGAFLSFLNKQTYDITGNNDDNAITGGARNDELYGLGGADHLFGGAGNDLLDGGAGKDVLAGGKGDDTYYIGVGDKVVEAAGKTGGFDTVVSSNTVDLSKFKNVEALTLTGKGKINGTGDGAANTLTGNDAANVLDGGKGIDKLIGGNGDDTYFIDNAKDVIIETGKKDQHDTIDSTVSVNLAKLKTIEDVLLLGKGDIDVHGNASNNILTGNKSDNEFWGGAGKDTLKGGGGVDTFHFVKGDKFDTILDFDASGKDHDVIDLSDYGSKALKFANLDIDKVKGGDVEINLGQGDTLHLHFVSSTAKDLDASDFLF